MLHGKVEHGPGVVYLDFLDDEDGSTYRAELFPEGARTIAADLNVHANGADAAVALGALQAESLANGGTLPDDEEPA